LAKCRFLSLRPPATYGIRDFQSGLKRFRLSLLPSPTQAVSLCVAALRVQLQILDSIVRSVAIDVMHALARFQIPTEFPFHDQDMLEDILSLF
jgi:hypothetical protein